MIHSSSSVRGPPVLWLEIRFTVNSTSIDVSSALPVNSPVTLGRVAVTNEQQRTRLVNRQIDRDALTQRVAVHVSGPRSQPARLECPLVWWRDANAAQHRPQWYPEVPQMLRRFGQRGKPALPVELPLRRTISDALSCQPWVFVKRPVIAGVRRVPQTPWYVVAKVSAAEVRTNVLRRSLELGLIAISLILAAGAGVAVLWRRQQLRSYKERFEAEVKHRALRGRYDHLSRFANDIILLLDDTRRIVEANDRAPAYTATRAKNCKAC